MVKKENKKVSRNSCSDLWVYAEWWRDCFTFV